MEISAIQDWCRNNGITSRELARKCGLRYDELRLLAVGHKSPVITKNTSQGLYAQLRKDTKNILRFTGCSLYELFPALADLGLKFDDRVEFDGIEEVANLEHFM
jgi:hypothetical protein